jgi:hypothetical protein
MNYNYIQREHLLELKYDTSQDHKLEIQKLQQAIDNKSYGAKHYRKTRARLTKEEFLFRFANPPEVHPECTEVYTYLGGMYIQVIGDKHYWDNDANNIKQLKSLAALEKFMCSIIFDSE